MSHKLVCVATKVGAAAELIVDGLNGFLVDPDDTDSIETALLHCLSISPEQRQAIGANAHDFVRDNLSLPNYIEQLKNLYLS
jgi:glycosyltransferase involved in cell wall biosynthesis